MKLAENLWEKALVSETSIFISTTIVSRNCSPSGHFVVVVVIYQFMQKKRFLVVLIMQEIRDIASMEGIKGKHFFLEADVKGPSLKLDNTGKAILTVSILVSIM